MGLELQEEEEALVPESRRGRAVPCRVIAGFTAPALEPHPAGYLIVGVGDGDEAGASAILEALARLRSGEALMLRVQRNPYLSPDAEWWEARVVLRLP